MLLQYLFNSNTKTEQVQSTTSETPTVSSDSASENKELFNQALSKHLKENNKNQLKHDVKNNTSGKTLNNGQPLDQHANKQDTATQGYSVDTQKSEFKSSFALDQTTARNGEDNVDQAARPLPSLDSALQSETAKGKQLPENVTDNIPNQSSRADSVADLLADKELSQSVNIETGNSTNPLNGLETPEIPKNILKNQNTNDGQTTNKVAEQVVNSVSGLDKTQRKSELDTITNSPKSSSESSNPTAGSRQEQLITPMKHAQSITLASIPVSADNLDLKGNNPAITGQQILKESSGATDNGARTDNLAARIPSQSRVIPEGLIERVQLNTEAGNSGKIATESAIREQLITGVEVKSPKIIDKTVPKDQLTAKGEANLDAKLLIKGQDAKGQDALSKTELPLAKEGEVKLDRLLRVADAFQPATKPIVSNHAVAQPVSLSMTQTQMSNPMSPSSVMASEMSSSTNQSNSVLLRDTALTVNVPKNQWNQRFAERISMLTLKGTSHARIRLDPPELGPMAVRIHTQGGETSIQFTVNNPIARDLVDSGSQRLREMLEEHGFDSVDVGVNQFARGREHQEDNELDQSDIDFLSKSEIDSDPESNPISTYHDSIGIIDIFA